MTPKVVRLMDPNKAAAYDPDYDGVEGAAAFAALGRRRYLPVNNPEQLKEVMKEIIKERRARVLFE